LPRDTPRLHSSYERGCQATTLLHSSPSDLDRCLHRAPSSSGRGFGSNAWSATPNISMEISSVPSHCGLGQTRLQRKEAGSRPKGKLSTLAQTARAEVWRPRHLSLTEWECCSGPVSRSIGNVARKRARAGVDVGRRKHRSSRRWPYCRCHSDW
jgi:hypothetical protein